MTSDFDFSTKLREAGSKLVVINFHAQWCGPCKRIAPEVESMAAEMSNVLFLKVDVDECYDVAAMYNVRAIPTFVFIKDDGKLDSFSGAKVGQLRKLVNRYR